MTPEDSEERVRAYIDGELSPAEVARLHRDAKDDGALAAVLEAQCALYRRIQGRAPLELPPPPRPSLWARLMLGSWLPGRATLSLRATAVLALMTFMGGMGFEHRLHASRALPSAAPETLGLGVPVRFVFTGEAQSVAVVGSFNQWRPQPLTRVAPGLWEETLTLPRGDHRYGFQVDGRWQPDPLAPGLVPDGMGGQDSLLKI